MHSRRSTLNAIPALLLTFVLIGCGTVAPVANEYKPTIAQEGKDVIWIPTPTGLAERMLKSANVTKNDLVYDLGAGDGKIAILAAKQFNATAIGIEFNPDMADYARKNVQLAGVSNKVSIITGDIFKEDFSKATVVTLYLLPALNIRLRPTILAMKPGTRVVSNTFTMGNWTADQTVQSDSGHMGYLWIVPAKVEGSWTISGLPGLSNSHSLRLSILQQYQEITGTLEVPGRTNSISIKGRLNGDQISFEYRDQTGVLRSFVGSVENNMIKGSVKGDPSITISAKKTS
ncbi:AdoMet_MTases domain containing protein [Burkholderiaceae bacterium]